MEEKEKRCRFLSVLWANMFSCQYYLVIYIYVMLTYIRSLSFFPFISRAFFHRLTLALSANTHTHTHIINKKIKKKGKESREKKPHFFFVFAVNNENKEGKKKTSWI